MTNEIKITMLGYRNSGKTSYLLAAAEAMRIGVDGFALAAKGSEAQELQIRWQNLKNVPHDWPVGDHRLTLYDFDMMYKANFLAALTWADHRGGDAIWIDHEDGIAEDDEPEDVKRLKELIEQIAASDCIFLCLPGDIISAFRSERERLAEALKMPSLRNIFSAAGRKAPTNVRKPLAVAVIITMADFLGDDLEGAIKDVMAILFSSLGLLAPRGLSPNPSYLVGIFPVSLGLELFDDKYNHQIDPIWATAPILFAAWARTRQLTSDRRRRIAVSNFEVDAPERLKILGEHLEDYPIAHDEIYLSEAGKLVGPDQAQPARIFISHSSDDNEFCERLKTALESVGAEVWFDKESTRAGRIVDQLEQNLKDFPTTIVVLSPSALASDWVPWECKKALDLEIFDRSHFRQILPVTAVRYNTSGFVLDTSLQELKRIEMKDGSPYPTEMAIAMILQSLDLTPLDNQSANSPNKFSPVESNVTGKALLIRERYEEAMEAFKDALNLDDNNYEALTGLAYAFLVTGNPVKSLETSYQACHINPAQAKAWELIGAAYHGLDENYLQDAVNAYNQALARDRHNAMTWSNLAQALYDLGQDREALVAIDEALKIDDSVAYRWNIRGDILARLEKNDAAQAAYAHAIDIDSRRVDALDINPSSFQS